MYKKMSLEELKSNLELWREHSDEEAYRMLIICNQYLIEYVITNYINKGLPEEDITSIGKLGLMEAINDFDYKNKNIGKFNLYALNYIESRIQMELQLDYEQKNLLDSSLKNMEDETIEFEVASIVDEQSKSLLQNMTSKGRRSLLLEYLSGITVDDIKAILNGDNAVNCEQKTKIMHKTI